MANWTGVITNAGNNVLLEWINEKTLHFNSAAAGQGTVETVGMLAQTALVNQKQVASIIGAERVSMGIRLKIRITAPQAAYTLNQYGVWASITGGSTTMIALFQHEKGIPIPSAAESPDFVYTFYALISTSNTGKWTVNIDTSASVTLEEMNAAIATAVATKEGVIKDASEKDSLADADCIAVVDSADGGKTKRVMWSTVKAALAKLFVPLTRKINGKTLSSDVTLTGEDIKVSASSSTTIDAVLAPLGGATTAQGIVDALGALLAVAAAAAYNPEGSYAVGDYCTHGGKLHKCGTPIESGEAWNAAHWTETSVAAELAGKASSVPPEEYAIVPKNGAQLRPGCKNAFSIDPFGKVTINGILTSTAYLANSTVLFTLPASFAPSETTSGAAYCLDSTNTAHPCSLVIEQNGDVRFGCNSIPADHGIYTLEFSINFQAGGVL